MEKKCKLCEFSINIAKFSDTHTILETILTQAREISNADAGTIYLRNDNNTLDFAYTQNDTLFPNEYLKFQELLRLFVDANIQNLTNYAKKVAKPFSYENVHGNEGDLPSLHNIEVYKKSGIRLKIIPIYTESMQYQGLFQCISSSSDDRIDVSEKNIAMLQEKALQLCEYSKENDYAAIQRELIQAMRDLPCYMFCFYHHKSKKTLYSFFQEKELGQGNNSTKLRYLKASLPINSSSITGYVASTMKSLNIPDVHKLSQDLPYHFNASFDKKNNDKDTDKKEQYRTGSMLTLPLIGMDNQLLGVLQLINATHNGEIIPFSSQIEEQVEKMAHLASNALESSVIAEENVLRINRTAALRDPAETTNHVIRVGYLASEIYAQWAENNGIPYEVIRQERGTLRLAAMLHDVGKVGIPDAVLKKPGAFTPEERTIMEKHSFLGSELFVRKNDKLDLFAKNVVLHHHQKWNGKGYTGSDLHPVLSGTDIPLEARIVAVADVYDALRSKRCYKDEQPHDEVIKIMQKDAGAHFDPELIGVLVQIRDTVFDIFEKYSTPPLP